MNTETTPFGANQSTLNGQNLPNHNQNACSNPIRVVPQGHGRSVSPPGLLKPGEPLPHSIEAEQGVIGCLLLDPTVAFPLIADEGINAGHFYDMRYGQLFVRLRRLYREKGNYDLITVMDRLRDAGELEALGGPPMLSSLTNHVPCASAITLYLDALKDKRRRRFMYETAARIQQLALDARHDSAPLLAEVVEQIRGMERIASGNKLSLRSPDEVLALPSDQQDNILGDRLLAKGQSLTLMGAGGIGKSRLLLQLAACCILGRPFASLDTHAPGLRWLIFQAENSVRRLQMDLGALRRWAGADWEQLNQNLLIHTIESSGDYFLSLDNAGARRRMADLIERHEADVVCFDPLNVFGIGDLNTDHDMRQTCLALTDLVHAGNPRRAIVVLHHALTGKLGAARAVGFERSGFGRNSKLLHAWTRGQINLAPGSPDDNNTLVISCGKCSNGQEFEPYAIALDPATMIYHKDHEFDLEEWQSGLNGKPTMLETAQHKELLREICASLPPRKDAVEKIKARLKCSSSTAYNILARAAQSGLIQIDGNLVRNAPERNDSDQ